MADLDAMAEPSAVQHHVAAVNAWPWLPTQRSGILIRHPYCTDCGLVKFVGASRGMDLGGITNLLGRLGRFLRRNAGRLTEAHQRLIVQGVRDRGLDDPFSLSREAQYGHLARLLSEILGHPPEVIESYLRSC